MTNSKAAGFTSIKSNSAVTEDLDLPTPLATALTQRRQKMAAKRAATDPNPELDPMGNPVPDENSDQ